MIELWLTLALLHFLKVAGHIVAAPGNKETRCEPVPPGHSVFWKMPRQASGKMAEFQLHGVSQHDKAMFGCIRTFPPVNSGGRANGIPIRVSFEPEKFHI